MQFGLYHTIPTQYQLYRVKETVYVKNKAIMPADMQQRFTTCEGEIYLYNIPANLAVATLFDLLLKFDPIYVLRFKITRDGKSRGYAFLQYLDPNRCWHALQWLPIIFEKFNICIRATMSANCNTLSLEYSDKTPYQVYDLLQRLLIFRKLRTIEYRPNKFIFHVVFDNYEIAARARRKLILFRHEFGPQCYVKMIDKSQLQMLGIARNHCVDFTLMDFVNRTCCCDTCYICK